ncbi:MAG: ABC transporter ATP-binding protein [Methanocorpusculum sp.]|nr:ABC transporter ATP-binding protein [Methanocorpusculum sp.]
MDYEIVEDALRRLSLADMQLRYIDEISGGELQRVCICRAIVQELVFCWMNRHRRWALCRQMAIPRVIRDVVDHHNVATIMTMHNLNLPIVHIGSQMLLKPAGIGSIHTPRLCVGLLEIIFRKRTVGSYRDTNAGNVIRIGKRNIPEPVVGNPHGACPHIEVAGDDLIEVSLP